MIRPIKTDEDYRAALTRVEELFTAAPDTPESDELDVLATLVDAYERVHHRIDPPDPVAAIRFRLEQQGLSPSDLPRILKVTRGRSSEILNKKRPLTIGMIRTLHQWGIPATTLIQDYRSKKPRAATAAKSKPQKTAKRPTARPRRSRSASK